MSEAWADTEQEMWEEPEQERFTVTDDQKADWCMRKIAEADKELERLNEWYKRQMEHAQERRDSKVAYFTGLLQDYFIAVPYKETKTTFKYALPSGELMMNKPKEDYKVADPEALVYWCAEYDQSLLKVTTAPKWADIKKRLTTVDGKAVDKETGLFVSGVEIEVKEAEFKVKARE